ncbi:DUF4377 domain-containing protein [Luteibacter aegosomaticola]|jgi:hypothetical protein|uniref:DUF4377 domain-containing protein n=1 Tax=Luteibacter aegosomaticola TaxID=2911538 RepID=UPI001FFB2CC4|nr:DUF4377 domain-containing protein [Luteibacter aegosomaticola]UPG90669.1 DUF4377 domain-containing protein [Luteibacter aegosomaticola]
MRIALLSAAALALAGCATTGDHHGSRERTLYISAEKAPCSAGAMKTECLQYREQPNQPWQLNYAPVDNFEWKPGNEYLVKVTEVEVKNPPADASRVRWRVDKIVEQHPVDKPPVP